jgi:amino acid adenylation domain-containing protein
MDLYNPPAAFRRQSTHVKLNRTVTVAERKKQAISPRATAGPVPLFFAQERLWFLDQLEPENRAYNQLKAVRLRGALDVAALRRALDTVVSRHEVLRTTFQSDDQHPVQIVGECRAVELPILDISSITGEKQDAALQELATVLAERRFDLSHDLMLRGALVKLGAADHALILVTHHIASDGWSNDILWRELGTLYGAFSKGEASPLPDLPIQYADFAVWQRRRFQGDALENEVSYWKQQLSNLNNLDLPTDRTRPPMQTYCGAQESYRLSRHLSDRLQALGRMAGVTLFMLLQGAFQTLLHRYTGQADFAVGSPIAGRVRPEIEGLIGFFVNMLVLRTDLAGNPTFREFVLRVRKVALAAYEHQELPFERLVEAADAERDLSRSPLFQVMFAFQNLPRHAVEFPGLTASFIETKNRTAKYDLSLYMWEDNGLAARLEYNTDLFDSASMRRMLANLETLLQAIVENPEQRISDLPILPAGQRNQILSEWNQTERELPKEQFVHRLFEAQVARSPDRIAVVFQSVRLTYRDLNARANRLANYLHELGVGPEIAVGVCMERSWEMVVAVLAVLKAGGLYVPLDPTHPRERSALVLEDARIGVLITQQSLLNDLPEVNIAVICLDRDRDAIERCNSTNPIIRIDSANLAYVIYTSGSTGRPKGVQVSHGALMNFLEAMRERPGLSESDILLAVTTVSFDIAGLELYLPLSVGAQVVLAPSEVAADGLGLLQLLEDCHATAMQATPATWQMLLEAGWKGEEKLKILCGGEPLPRKLADSLMERASTVWNMYGPTETTVWSAIHHVQFEAGDPIPIGRPIHNTQIYILDANLNPVPIGVLGELYIGGAGLARGYRNRPELTGATFIPDPFARSPGGRLYRTGDRARFRADGTIAFLGRTDQQVKIRGFRIEPAEIESILRQHPSVHEAIVLARGDMGDHNTLVAYVVARGGTSISAPDLKKFLKSKLPDYMRPSWFIFLKEWPMTANGKINRQALPAPCQSSPELEGVSVTPRTVSEKAIAGVWAELLKVERLGIHDNFFDLGGHSLLATQVIARLRKTFQVDLPVRALFDSPTVAGLAAQLAVVQARQVVPRNLEDMIAELETLSEEEAARLLQPQPEKV